MAEVPSYKPFTPTGVPANINVGKLGHETTAFDLPFKARSAAPAVVGPDNIYEYMRQIWQPGILEHKFRQNLLLWAFNAPVEDGWMNNLSVSHSARITFKKWMNPLQRVRVAELQYKSGVECPKQLDLDCVIPPAGPLDDYEQVDVDFRFEYSIRADVCVKTRKLTLGEVESNYSESLEAVSYRRAIDAWTALAEQIIASGSPTLIPSFVTKLGATNYLDAGTADVYQTLTTVFSYMGRVHPDFKSNFLITVHPDIALDLANSCDNTCLAYNTTGVRQDWIDRDDTAFGSFEKMFDLPRWRGIQVLIAPDDVAMHNATPNGDNFNPWENDDGTKVRAIIAARDSFWTKTVQLMDKTMFNPTVDNPVQSIVEIWIGGDKLIYPERTYLVEFDRP
jgi:hypothetical protein